MKIIHMDGFSVDERKSYSSVICSNIVVSMRALLFAAKDMGLKTSKSNKVSVGSVGLRAIEFSSASCRRCVAPPPGTLPSVARR